jgi:predicted transcriptional regulator
MSEEQTIDLTALTADLVSAFVSNNNVRNDDLPGLIQATHAALAGLSTSPAAPQEEKQEYTPAVTARRSLKSRDHIISMVDGKPYRSLKRHLGRHGLTPDEYRHRYNLPSTYPMVAPAYSEQRREVAKRLGLGRKKGQASSSPSGKGTRRGRKGKPQS